MGMHWTIFIISSILIVSTLVFSHHVWGYSEGNDVILKQDPNIYIIQYYNGNGDIINLSDSVVENIVLRINEHHGSFVVDSQAILVKPILRPGESSPFFSIGDVSDCDEIWVESYEQSDMDKVQNILQVFAVKIVGDEFKRIEGQLKNNGTKNIYEDIWAFKVEYEENKIIEISYVWLEKLLKGETKSFSISYSDKNEYEILGVGRIFDRSDPTVGTKFDIWFPTKTLYVSNYHSGSLTPRYLDINELTISDEQNTCQVEVNIPNWLRNTAKWWSQGSIGDRDFVQGIQYLIKQEIIQIPSGQAKSTTPIEKIPEWIKTNAKWWSEGKISDNDFSKGIEYMIKEGIIRV